MKQGILVPFDGSANATQALRLAIEMAEMFGENIILLNVQPSFETFHTKMFFTKHQIHEYQQELSREVTAAAVKILNQAGVPFITKMRVGDAKVQICQEAAGGTEEVEACTDAGVRLIIMGSRGMNAVVGGVLGSVSYGVLHHAPCPVVVVPFSC
jgi:nucleotide-binding universal stress UspA family protein